MYLDGRTDQSYCWLVWDGEGWCLDVTFGDLFEAPSPRTTRTPSVPNDKDYYFQRLDARRSPSAGPEPEPRARQHGGPCPSS